MKFEKRSIRIFISSTFRDMMPEREHLMKIIFPELRRRCRKKWVDITEVDLRWGILEQEAKEGKVIEICLNEIDKSRPYFIGLLGERYGWVPFQEEYDKHAKKIEAFKWVKEDIEEGLSITEMEIQYGVLRNADMKERAFFYLKDMVPDENIQEENADRLEKLKTKIKEQKQFPAKDYHSVEELGQMILEDLWESILERFPDEDIPDSHELENLNQLAVIGSHLDFYNDASGNIAALDALLKTHAKVAIYAENGMGKSALLANWMQHIWDDAIVIPYMCGSTADSTDLEKMTRHLAVELKNRFDITHSIPQRIESPKSLLNAFLNETDPQKPLCLVIDDVDQLQVNEENLQLRWLPTQLPAHVKLIISTEDKSKISLLEKADFQLLSLAVLPAVAVEQIVENYFQFFSKKLPEEQLQKIKHAPLNVRPIVLLTLVNELRLFGTHEEIPAQIDYYIQYDRQSDFFQAFLQQLENDYTQEKFKLKEILSLLTLSHQGLSETEIIQITGITPLSWSQVYNVLEFHLIDKNGIIQLNNKALIRAVQKRYLSDDVFKTAQQQTLAHFFYEAFNQIDLHTDAGTLTRVVEELPDLLFEMKDSERFKAIMTCMPVFEYLFQKRQEDLGGYLVFLRETYALGEIFDAPVQACMASEWEVERKIAISFYVANALLVHDNPQHAIPFFYNCLTVFNQHQVKTSYVIEALKQLASIFTTLGQYDAATYLLENLLVYEKEAGIAESFDLLAQQYSSTGAFEKAEMLTQDALAYSIDRYGEASLLVALLYNNLGSIYDKQKVLPKAEAQYQKALEIGEKLLGRSDTFCQTALSNLGVLYLNEMQLERSMTIFKEVFDMRKTLYGRKHPLTLKTTNSLGVCNLRMGKHEEAQRLLEQAYEDQTEILGALHPNTTLTLSNLANLTLKQKKYFKAERLQRELLDIYKKTYGEVNEQVINLEMALAATLIGQEKKEEAVKQYETAIPIQIQFYGADHPMVKLTRFKVYEIQAELEKIRPEDAEAFMDWFLYHGNQSMEAGDFKKAEYYFKEVYAVGEQVFQGANKLHVSAIEGLAGLYYQWEKYPEAAHFSEMMMEGVKVAIGETAPIYLQFKTVTAFNYYKAGAYEEAMKLLMELGDEHENMLNFPEAFVTKMYRELLSFFNAYQRVIKNYDNDPQKVDKLYEEAQEKLNKAFDNNTVDNYPETLRQVEEVVAIAELLNNEYGQPYPAALYAKAQVLESMGRINNAIETLTEGIRYLTRWNPDFHPLVERYALKLGEMLSNQENNEGALFFYNRAERINSMLEDFPNEDTLKIYSAVVMLYLEEGNMAKTLEWIETALPIAIEMKGESDPIVENFLYVKKEMKKVNQELQN